MKNYKIIRNLILLTLLFSLFPPAYAGWQCSTDNNDAMLPHMLSENGLTDEYYDNRIFVTTDSGENWKVITVAISNYYYGSAAYEEKINIEAADKIVEQSYSDSRDYTAVEPDNVISLDSRKNSSSIGNESGEIPARLINYLVKITNYTKYNISSDGGRESVNVSHEKLTQGLYNFRIDGSDLIRTFNYYRLESKEGIFKDEWFS